MVYETDFYTSRRPYSRPTISSYSVTTPLRVIPGVARVYTTYSPYTSSYYSTPSYYSSPYTSQYSMPHYTSNYGLPGSLYMPSAVPLRYYTRSAPVRVISSPLRDYSPPRIFSINVRPSVIHRELMRIEHKSRPHYGYDPTEEYLNSPSAREFEDDIRSIRTQTSKVLNRIHAPMPRSRRAVSCAPFSRYGYDSSEREFYDNIRGKPTVQDDIFTMSRYAEPAKRYTGKSHLASVRICGNKGYPVRQPASHRDEIYDPARVHNEIQYLSHYMKNRRAAADKENRGVVMESASKKTQVEQKPIINSSKLVEYGNWPVEI